MIDSLTLFVWVQKGLNVGLKKWPPGNKNIFTFIYNWATKMHNSTINCVTIETITYPLVLFCGLCTQRSPQALGLSDFTKSAGAVIRDVSLNNDQWPKYSKDLQMTSSEETTVCEKNTISLERRGVPDEIGSGAWKNLFQQDKMGILINLLTDL